MSNYLLFDIGGTKTRVAASYSGESLTEPVIYQTPQLYSQGLAEIVRVGKSLSSEGFEGICGGIAGPLNKDKSGIINAPNIPDWNNKLLQRDLEVALEAKVKLENDTAMVGLGEATEGAGKDYNIVVYITVSTGVNGVRVVSGKLDDHHFGFEIGKQILDVETGSSWEEMILHDGETTDKEAELISAGVFNSVLFWSPDVVILGGGRMQEIEIEQVKIHLHGLLKIYPELPVITKSELGEMGGLYGALHYLRQ